MYSTMKRRGNDRFHVISMWNIRCAFVVYFLPNYPTEGNSVMICHCFFTTKIAKNGLTNSLVNVTEGLGCHMFQDFHRSSYTLTKYFLFNI